jgi:hypothetical protein
MDWLDHGTGVEDHLTTMMAYYDIPSLSFRNAMYHIVRRNRELFRRIWMNKDEIHPSDAGARYLTPSPSHTGSQWGRGSAFPM